jgi:ABC-2 type transport system ATP-binding protein
MHIYPIIFSLHEIQIILYLNKSINNCMASSETSLAGLRNVENFSQETSEINNVMISIQNLTKRYDDILAVDNLSFDVYRGEVFGLLGSNGAGKTTTMQIIAGLLKPTAGDIYVSGMNILQEPLKVKALLGYLPESPAVYEQLTGREFLNFIGRLRGLSESEISKRVSNITKILDLDARIDSKLNSYSKGMKQKISFAGTILHDPELVLLDEPISGLDPRYGKLIKDWILKEKSEDKTILLSSHMTELVEASCNRVIILDKGKIKGFGTVPELLEQTGTDNLEDTFIQLTGGRIKVDF